MRMSGRQLIPTLLVFSLVAVSPEASTQTVQERLKALAPLVGTWDTEDVYRPDSPTPSVERGVRRCVFAVANRYVQCITEGTNAAGRTREYRFYLTWDDDRGRYTFLSFWSNVGNMSLTTFTIDATGKVWDIRSTTPYVENGVETRSWSTLTFVTTDTIEWVGRSNVSSDPPTSWPVVFRETWKRRVERQ